jgi:hypothetical protein
VQPLGGVVHDAEKMNIRKLVYTLAVVMLSYDVLSTLIASKLYGRFADLSSVNTFLGQKRVLLIFVF